MAEGEPTREGVIVAAVNSMHAPLVFESAEALSKFEANPQYYAEAIVGTMTNAFEGRSDAPPWTQELYDLVQGWEV